MTTCPKCAYERKPVEEAPEWQCPSCGVAYIKVMSDSRRANEQIHARSGSARKLPTTEPIDRRIKLMLGVLITIAAVGGLWKWKHPNVSNINASPVAKLDQAIKYFNDQRNDLAIPLLTPLAEQGDAKASYYLGRIYQTSKGVELFGGRYYPVPAMSVKSEYWFEAAANKGDVLSQLELARMYYHNGKGEKARYWYEQAAALGDPDAQYHMGLYAENRVEGSSEIAEVDFPDVWNKEDAMNLHSLTYKVHSTVPGRDYSQAAKWYRMAAEQGNAGGLFRLGKLYAKGNGVQTNLVTAYALLTLAAEKHNADLSVRGAYLANDFKAALEKKLTEAEKKDGSTLTTAIKNGAPIPE